MTDDNGLTAEELVQAANKVIVYAGLITRVGNVEEVRAVCSSSSLLVAALEGFLGRRLDGILRNPKTPSERAQNINFIVDVLSQLLSCDLSHISGDRIVEGSIEDITNILELLAVVCQGRPLQGPPPPAHGQANWESSASEQQAMSSAHARERPLDTLGLREGSLPEHLTGSSDDGNPEEYPSQNAHDSADGQSPREHDQLSRDGEKRSALRRQQRRQGDDDAGPHPHAYQRQQQNGDGHPKGSSRERRRKSMERLQEAVGSLSQCTVRVRTRGSGRRQRISLHRAAIARHSPLSPIQEVSREGWENSRASKETPRPKAVDEVARVSSGSTRAALIPHSSSADPRCSASGASSSISVPSVAQEVCRRSVGDPSSSSSHQYWEQQQQQQAVSCAATSAATSEPSSRSESTSTLLDRALSQAEATLRALGREYEDFYYHDDDSVNEGSGLVRIQRRMRKDQSQRPAYAANRPGPGQSIFRNCGPATYEPARRALRANPWPDNRSGLAQQHEAFLRRAKQVLTDRRSGTTSSTGVPPTSASGSRSGLRSHSSKRSNSQLSARGLAKTSLGATTAREGGHSYTSNSRRGSPRDSGGAHEALVRALSGSTATETDVIGQSRKLMQRVSTASYSQKSRCGLSEQHRDADSRTGLAAKRHGAMQLNPGLEAKLRYLYRLMAEDPKHRAARATVESMVMANDMLRQTRRRALVDRLSNARARRDAVLRLTTDRLREQGREYNKRMEQLRLQRLAVEWSASQRSAQMRRALQAELTLRDAFIEVLQREKEVLLAERQEAKADAEAAFPTYKKVLRKAESDYREIFSLLENLLASERLRRVRADREAEQAQRDFNQLAANVVYDRMQELLGRIAREEEVDVQRRSITTEPKAKRSLIAQIRTLLGLS